jgi:hypothetical protein
MTRPPALEVDRALACAHAQIAAAIQRSGPGDLADRQASAECHADLAVHALATAISTGALRKPVAAELLQSDPDLDALRSRPDFQILRMDLVIPDDPFSR